MRAGVAVRRIRHDASTAPAPSAARESSAGCRTRGRRYRRHRLSRSAEYGGWRRRRRTAPRSAGESNPPEQRLGHPRRRRIEIIARAREGQHMNWPGWRCARRAPGGGSARGSGSSSGRPNCGTLTGAAPHCGGSWRHWQPRPNSGLRGLLAIRAGRKAAWSQTASRQPDGVGRPGRVILHGKKREHGPDPGNSDLGRPRYIPATAQDGLFAACNHGMQLQLDAMPFFVFVYCARRTWVLTRGMTSRARQAASGGAAVEARWMTAFLSSLARASPR